MNSIRAVRATYTSWEPDAANRNPEQAGRRRQDGWIVVEVCTKMIINAVTGIGADTTRVAAICCVSNATASVTSVDGEWVIRMDQDRWHKNSCKKLNWKGRRKRTVECRLESLDANEEGTDQLAWTTISGSDLVI